MPEQTVFTDDYKLTPYWWDQSPRPSIDESPTPEQIEVAVIGSGYTGLNAALVTARSGRTTAVFDAEDMGFGCSTRNGGQISTSVKPELSTLTRKHGRETAFNIIKEGHNALSWLQEFIQTEAIDCDFIVPGRFHAAHSSRAFKQLVAEVSDQPKGLEVPFQIVPRSEQHTELGTNAYHGGVIFEQHASVDPARYHQGLLEHVKTAGADLFPHCPITNIKRSSDGYTLQTRHGTTKAKEVVVATNGYTGTITPWQHRRVIPIGSYIIATDVIEPQLMERLVPTDRILSDTQKVVYYYRPSPDKKRILFGGRVSSSETNPEVSAPLLKRDLDYLFPELASVKVSHSWMGFVAYTFDSLAHTGKHDGIHYAMGYCGSGVSMASYLGMRVGQQVIGLAEGKTAFDEIPFPTRPLYTGKPWFLPATIAYYRWHDRRGRKSG